MGSIKWLLTYARRRMPSPCRCLPVERHLREKKQMHLQVFCSAMPCAAFPWQKGEMNRPGRKRCINWRAIAQMQSWQGTADYSPMQASLQRQQMVGTQVPLSSLHGFTLTNGQIGAAPDRIEARHSDFASLCSLVTERLRGGKPSSQTRTATDHLRNHQLECQHRPGRCPVQSNFDRLYASGSGICRPTFIWSSCPTQS